MTGTIRIVVVDDHEIVRRGLVGLFESTPDFQVVGAAASAAAAVDVIRDTRPDLVVLDVQLPDGSGIEVCREVRSVSPAVRCVMLTTFDDDDAAVAAVLAGASGYLLKEVRGTVLVDSLRKVAGGASLLQVGVLQRVVDQLRAPGTADSPGPALTERDRQLLDLIAEGLTNRQIGERLYLAEKTVKNYVSALLMKLGMQRRTQIAAYAVRTTGH